MKTLEQQLRVARQEGNTDEIQRIKGLMNIDTRNMKTTTVYNQKGKVLSVRQQIIDVVPCNDQADTIEESIYI
jgi:hypothetical protein